MQKKVAHDFRYDPRIILYMLVSTPVRIIGSYVGLRHVPRAELRFEIRTGMLVNV